MFDPGDFLVVVNQVNTVILTLIVDHRTIFPSTRLGARGDCLHHSIMLVVMCRRLRKGDRCTSPRLKSTMYVIRRRMLPVADMASLSEMLPLSESVSASIAVTFKCR